ncbi:MAG TPA: RNA polymerase sigma factor [Acidimicrobiales bacterium]|nr:RNA polymerase sigma factor [Acidimicrobiales bacterium]
MWGAERKAAAFEELYRRCYRPLVDLCRRTLCGRGDAEAIAQEAFERAWTSIDRFTDTRPFWPWVATIAKRLCVDHRRRLERENAHRHIEAESCRHRATPPDETVEVWDDYRSARLALKELRPYEQRIIELRDVQGWSYDEIARLEGVTVEAIRGSLKRARASLRKSFARL